MSDEAAHARVETYLERTATEVWARLTSDAGCGAGQMTAELAARGAQVLACDISPSLVDMARGRLSYPLKSRFSFHPGDMLDPALGRLDHVVALGGLASRTTEQVVFTVAPRRPLLMAMWRRGKLFPRADRSPVMVPHSARRLPRALREPGDRKDLAPRRARTRRPRPPRDRADGGDRSFPRRHHLRHVVDESEQRVRYLEITLDEGHGGGKPLVPPPVSGTLSPAPFSLYFTVGRDRMMIWDIHWNENRLC